MTKFFAYFVPGGVPPVVVPALTAATLPAPVATYDQSVSGNLLAPVTLIQPVVTGGSSPQTIDGVVLSPAALPQPAVAPEQQVTADLLSPTAVLQPAVAFPVIVPALSPTSLPTPGVLVTQYVTADLLSPTALPAPPMVSKNVAVAVEAHLTFLGTALATVTLTVDETPANDDPLTVGAGTLQLASEAATGATQLVLTATTLTGTVEAGDTLLVDGTTFTVTKSAAAEGNQITVDVSPQVPA